MPNPSENATAIIVVGMLFGTLLLHGCATSPLAPPVIAVKQVCLPQVQYSPEQQKAAADALAALTPDNPLVAFIADYGAVRRANLACIASTQGTKP